MRNNFIEVLRTKNFIKIWGSQLLSQLTVSLLNFVLILKIFESTHSTVAVSIFWFFWALPAIFLGPFSGTLIDFLGRGRVFGVLGFMITLASIFPVLFSATVGEFLGEIWMILILASVIFMAGFISLKGDNVIFRFNRS